MRQIIVGWLKGGKEKKKGEGRGFQGRKEEILRCPLQVPAAPPPKYLDNKKGWRLFFKKK